MKGAKLWKRVLNESIADPESKKNPDLQSKIVRATIIVDTRIRDDDAEKGMPWRWDKFNLLDVPFDAFWVEGATKLGLLWGCLVNRLKGTDGSHILSVIPVVAADKMAPLSFGSLPCLIRADGSLDAERIKTGKCLVLASNERQKEIFHNWIFTLADNLFDLLQMLGCKNVALQPSENEAKEVRKAVKRHGGTPEAYRYHTLVVRAPGSKPDAPGQDIGIMPRHLCRGHFSEYGPQFGKGLLFGKYAGRFYVPPHLKGNQQKGVVEKDYEV